MTAAFTVSVLNKVELLRWLPDIETEWVHLLSPQVKRVPATDELKQCIKFGLPLRFGDERLALDGESQTEEWLCSQVGFTGLLGACALMDNGKFINASILLRMMRTQWLRDNLELWDVDSFGFVLSEEAKLPLAYAPGSFSYQHDITLPLTAAQCTVEAIQALSFKSQLTTRNPFDRTIARRQALQARDIFDREEAFVAFEKLFVYYSFHEELERLRLMMEQLPYALEEDPRMDKFRALLDKQCGHLKLADAGTFDWYRNGSPSRVIDANYARTHACQSAGADRLKWFADQCTALGLKRALEMGSVDGFSLFQLMNYAPHIEWNGLEVSEDAVKHGHEVAAETGHPLKLWHAPDGFFRWSESHQAFGQFDAAALFEILEHNGEGANQTLIQAALNVLRPSGYLFITTPHGNWSAFDEHTRDIELAKDHVNAFTVKRMRAFLERCNLGDKIVEVREVQNANLFEANSWVYALVKTNQ